MGSRVLDFLVLLLQVCLEGLNERGLLIVYSQLSR